MESFFYYESPVGTLTLVFENNFLIGCDFGKIKKESLEGDLNNPIFIQTKNWLDIYFKGQNPDFFPPLKITGTLFQKMVGEIMLEIPFGETISYGEISKIIARKMGKIKMSAQAVGAAVGKNRIAIIVPCHRVVGCDGKLTGYAGGLEKKLFLLQNEGLYKSVDLKTLSPETKNAGAIK